MRERVYVCVCVCVCVRTCICAHMYRQRNNKIHDNYSKNSKKHDNYLSKRHILSTKEANEEHCLWDSFTERGKYESVLLNKQEFNCKDEGRWKPL